LDIYAYCSINSWRLIYLAKYHNTFLYCVYEQHNTEDMMDVLIKALLF
jgi:hypothetical protein